MNIMINVWEKMECLIVVVSVLQNNFKQDDDVRKKIKTVYEYSLMESILQEHAEDVREVIVSD